MEVYTLKSPIGKTFEASRMCVCCALHCAWTDGVVSAYGMMGLTFRDPPLGDEQAFETIKAAIDGGSNLLDTSEFCTSCRCLL